MGMALNCLQRWSIRMPNVPKHLPSARRPFIVLLLCTVRTSPPPPTNRGSSKRSLCCCHCSCMISTQCHVVATATLEFKQGLARKWTGNHDFYIFLQPLKLGGPRGCGRFSQPWGCEAVGTPSAGPHMRWPAWSSHLRQVTFAQWACPNMPQRTPKRFTIFRCGFRVHKAKQKPVHRGIPTAISSCKVMDVQNSVTGFVAYFGQNNANPVP